MMLHGNPSHPGKKIRTQPDRLGGVTGTNLRFEGQSHSTGGAQKKEFLMWTIYNRRKQRTWKNDFIIFFIRRTRCASGGVSVLSTMPFESVAARGGALRASEAPCFGRSRN